MPPVAGQPVPPAPPAWQAPPPPPVSPAVASTAAAAPAVQPALAGSVALPVGEELLSISRGTLYNDGQSVSAIALENHLVLVTAGGSTKIEEIPGLRFALIGDYDGDGTQDLAIVTGDKVWIQRYSALGMVVGGKVNLTVVPDNLTLAPFTYDGRSVLVTVTKEKVSFNVLHPARGLVEIGSAPVPVLEP